MEGQCSQIRIRYKLNVSPVRTCCENKINCFILLLKFIDSFDIRTHWASLTQDDFVGSFNGSDSLLQK